MACLAIGLYFYLLFCFIFIFLYALHIASACRSVPTDALCTYTSSGLSNPENRVSPTLSREILDAVRKGLPGLRTFADIDCGVVVWFRPYSHRKRITALSNIASRTLSW